MTVCFVGGEVIRLLFVLVAASNKFALHQPDLDRNCGLNVN